MVPEAQTPYQEAPSNIQTQTQADCSQIPASMKQTDQNLDALSKLLTEPHNWSTV